MFGRTVIIATLVILAWTAAAAAAPRVALLGGGAATIEMVKTREGRLARLTLSDGQRTYALLFTRNQLLEVRDAVFDGMDMLTRPDATRRAHIETITQAFGEPRQLNVRLGAKTVTLMAAAHGAEYTQVEVEADAPRLVKLKLMLEHMIESLK